LVLAKIKDHFPPMLRRDIRMEQLSQPDPVSGVAEFKFVHSHEYNKAQAMFEQPRLSGDLESTVQIVMTVTPYHVPTLLIIADNRIRTGNASEGADVL
jgi:hypothetical protein